MRSETPRRLFQVLAFWLLVGLAACTGDDRDAELAFEPEVDFPFRVVSVRGVPAEVDELELLAIAEGEVAGPGSRGTPLTALRLTTGDLAFVVPPHPAGVEKGGRFRVIVPNLPEGVKGGPLFLTVKPLPPGANAASRIADALEAALESIARASGMDPQRLGSGPMEGIPAPLFGVAVGLRLIGDPADPFSLRSVLEGRAPPEIQSEMDLELGDRLLAASYLVTGLEELAARFARLPVPPAEGLKPQASRRPRTHPSLDVGSAASGPSPGEWHPAVVGDAGAADPWEKVEICSQCPGALNHWMEVQRELEQGYDGLLERALRDRDVFDFLSSLAPPERTGATAKLEKGLEGAKKRAKKKSGFSLSKGYTPETKRYLNLVAAVKILVQYVVGLNDRMLSDLLPSELLLASASAAPLAFSEDDKRAEPRERGAGHWSLGVTARSRTFTWAMGDLMDAVQTTQSVIDKSEAALVDVDDDKRRGWCVPGGEQDEGAAVGVGEAGCDLARAWVKTSLKYAREYEKARDGYRKAVPGAGSDLPAGQILRFGPYAWPNVDVSNPKWTAARAIGDCVIVAALTWQTAESPWTQLHYSPADPEGSWGAVTASAQDVGYRPAKVGGCDLRLSTRADRFGAATPVHEDIPVRVKQIRVMVTPSPLTVEPLKEVEVDFESTVWNADSLDVKWSAPSGTGKKVDCPSGTRAKPCWRWTAPELEKGECRRTLHIKATSSAQRGLRRSGKPPREGRAAVEVVDPGARMAITYRDAEVATLNLEPEQRVRLSVTGPAAGDEVTWTATNGPIGRTGRTVPYRAPEGAGTYRITATTVRSRACSPEIRVVVGDSLGCSVPSQGDYDGTLGGERARVVEARSRGAFAKILPSPLGGWALQMRSRERGGRDLSMLLSFDELPEAGTSVHIESASWTDGQIGGVVDLFDPERHVSWGMGSIDILFTVVRDRPGKPFKWVCGEMSGELIGYLLRSPPGAAQPVRVTGTFQGNFRAEWFSHRTGRRFPSP